ncbi:hypothetical protein SG34_028905 [Thalassomonas viridans]|uniref:Uncharacterized protein n=1 Tax=Thalassomonas viridans TaxID=137584 RepID=A0AAF0C8Z8_9GAMM|nr:hypothetical protein [Thalassomonas viridans]WDE05263.1 hypothetical protein SG34_028905 [Thalassomonas viridans]
MKPDENCELLENRVLGRTLSMEDLAEVAAGACTPSKDGCVEPDGTDVECPL